MSVDSTDTGEKALCTLQCVKGDTGLSVSSRALNWKIHPRPSSPPTLILTPAQAESAGKEKSN